MNPLEELRLKEKALSTSINLLRLAKYNAKDACYMSLLAELAEVQEKINNISLITKIV